MQHFLAYSLQRATLYADAVFCPSKVAMYSAMPHENHPLLAVIHNFLLLKKMCIGNSDNFLAVAYHPSAHTRTCFLFLEAEGPSSTSIPEAELTWSSRSDMPSYIASLGTCQSIKRTCSQLYTDLQHTCISLLYYIYYSIWILEAYLHKLFFRWGRVWTDCSTPCQPRSQATWQGRRW